MKATIKDVATLADVSIATVSHVLNHTRFVTDKTRQKVENAIAELSYEKNYVGVSLRTRQSNMIALIVPVLSDETSNQFFMQVMLGIESILKPQNYMMVVSNSNDEGENEIELIKKFKQIQIDGLIITPSISVDHSFIKDLAGDVPVVFIDRKPANCTDVDCILTDSAKAIYDAVAEQIRRGHTKIGVIGQDISYAGNIRERIEGYKSAMRAANLRDDYVYFEKGTATIQAGYVFAKKLFTQYPDLSSIFVLNNCFGTGTLRFLQESGRRVPDDVNVTLFDDYEWNRACTPSITSIMQDSILIGKNAASVLLEKIRNPQKNSGIYYVPSRLIIRDSWNTV